MHVPLMAYGGVSYALNISKMRYDLGEVNARRGDSFTVSWLNSQIFTKTIFAMTFMSWEGNASVVGYLTMCKYDFIGHVTMYIEIFIGYLTMCKLKNVRHVMWIA